VAVPNYPGMNDDLSPAFVRAYPPAQPAPGSAIWLPFAQGDLLVRTTQGQTNLHWGDWRSVEALSLGEPLYVGTLDGLPCLAADCDGVEIPEGWAWMGLRALFGQLPEAALTLAGYASQMLYWRRTSGFCPVCGHSTGSRETDWGRICSECGHVAYPHVTPATLILVYDGPRLLLAQKPGWGTLYSILAGFVESGESLEDCVRREVKEEVGIEVTELAYAGSQPWPYPHQLMVGFRARYAGGAIKVDGEELERAGWFTIDGLPDLPSPVSLSRQMIDAWLAEREATPISPS